MPPTGGTAVMNGFDIRTQMKHVRSSLGLCPQHDVLFDTLTVHEHLTFYARVSAMLSYLIMTAAVSGKNMKQYVIWNK